MGSAVVEGLQQQILSIVGSVSGTSTLGDSADVGITLNSDGTLSFDQDAFESAYSANPKAVAALFTQGATFTPSAVRSRLARSAWSTPATTPRPAATT